MKILFAASKEMNLEDLNNINNTIHFEEVNDIINFIKSIDRETSYQVFKTKEDIYDLHQNIDIKSKKAIELFNGISFRQISDFNDNNLKDVMILSALYGVSYAFDYISPFRYDYTMKYAKTNRKSIYEKINELLKQEDVVYDLSSQEFSVGISHPNLIKFNFLIEKNEKLIKQSVASKKCRGRMLVHIISNGQEAIKNFDFDGFQYCEDLSTNQEYTFIQKSK